VRGARARDHGTTRGARRRQEQLNVRKKQLVIVGNGMATCRLLDELLMRNASARYDIAVFGEEKGGAYNRILLSKVLGGEQPDAIVTKPPHWYAERGVQLHDGVGVRRLDTGA
jgi:nitrite reductase (NADH) large subunit